MEEVETLFKLFPETKVILDHFGFCKSENPAWDKLLEWSVYPQVIHNIRFVTERVFRFLLKPVRFFEIQKKLTLIWIS